MMSSLRLVLRVDVLPGDEYNVAHATDGLWTLLDHLGPTRRPALLRGDEAWGIERVMSRAEQNGLAYLFRLRMTANVRRALTGRCAKRTGRMPAKVGRARRPACGWWLEPATPYHPAAPQAGAAMLAISDRRPAQPLLSFAEVGPDKEVWEYAALVTSLDSEILTLGQLYRDRADCENVVR